MEISLLKNKDVNKVSGLIRRVISNTPYYSVLGRKYESAEYTSRAINKEIKDKKHVYLVAKSGGKIIGFCHGYFDLGTFWVNWIGVDRNFRRKGIATTLALKLEDILRKRKVHKIWLDTRMNNKEGISFFKKLGYKKMASLKNHWYRLNFYLWHKFL